MFDLTPIANGVQILTYVFVMLQSWAPVLYAGVAAIAYLVVVRLLAFPLITRNPHELVVLLGANKATIRSVVDKHLPFFTLKKGAYWYGDGLQCEGNTLHVYTENVNQPVHTLKRMPNKEVDVMRYKNTSQWAARQTKPHKVLLPPLTRKVFVRDYVLILKKDTAELVPAKDSGLKGKQPYKIGFFRRLGVYEMAENEKAVESTNASDVVQSVTVQTVLQKIGNIHQHTNFSSVAALTIINKVRRDDRHLVRRLTGSMDPRLIMAIVMIAGIAAIGLMMWFVFKPDVSSLPPPPPEIANQLKGGTN
jgi:hypothetical protein